MQTSLFEQPHEMAERIIANIERVLIGKRKAVKHMLIAALCSGHVLLDDVPGVGKTTLVKALAKSFGCKFNRIQFTPDLLPSDITGISWYHPKKGEFEFREGPLMANIVLADEINRTAPRTQAALLEAMEERRVTVDGKTYPLPKPFMIMATQNPIDYEGTYPLPEAQMDRFLMRIQLGYPKPEHELSMLQQRSELHTVDRLRPVIVIDEWLKLQQQVQNVYIDSTLQEYIVRIVGMTRDRRLFRLGASPRASLALMKTAQANALLKGRRYVIPDDILEMLEPVLFHRVIMAADAVPPGNSTAHLLREMARKIPIPSLKYAEVAAR